MTDDEQASGGCRALPVVMIDDKAYFVDVRLRQLRSVCDVSDYIAFVPEKLEPWVIAEARGWGLGGQQVLDR